MPKQPTPTAPTTFASLGVAIEIVEALASRGIERPFAIQEYALPLALDGKDIIGQARTGTGKTLGFGVPVLDRVFDSADVTEPDGTPRALILVPTRELCTQVAEDLSGAARNLPLRIQALYGGVPFDKQIRQISAGIDIVVGTPGRLIDLMNRGELSLSRVEILVLDEADEMLDQGFIDDVRRIMSSAVPDHGRRQTMLFSATMPGPVMALTREFMSRPVMIQADDAAANATHHTTRQIVFQSHKLDRMDALSTILSMPGRGRTIVFAKTKRMAARLAEDVGQRGFTVAALHGDMRQPDRNKALKAFRSGATDIIVATDVAARGIDVEDVTHVINYQCPDEERTYVHRIGRTGRAGHSGMAVTLVGWDEVARWNSIAEALNLPQLVDPPQWFSNSKEFLDIFGSGTK